MADDTARPQRSRRKEKERTHAGRGPVMSDCWCGGPCGEKESTLSRSETTLFIYLRLDQGSPSVATGPYVVVVDETRDRCVSAHGWCPNRPCPPYTAACVRQMQPVRSRDVLPTKRYTSQGLRYSRSRRVFVCAGSLNHDCGGARRTISQYGPKTWTSLRCSCKQRS